MKMHDINAAGAGDLGKVSDGELLGPCPGCAAPMRIGEAMNPGTKRIERMLLHPVPFCAYFGATDPDDIVRAIIAAGTS